MRSGVVMNGEPASVLVLGAGPAGLGAAYRLALRDKFQVTVIERGSRVGGNAGSFEVGGMRVDFGSHRLHPSCSPEILSDIRNMPGTELIHRPRHGRIRLQGRWVHFPLKPADLALNLPLSFTAGVALDSAAKLVRRRRPSATFADVLEHGLGRTICRDFYFPYARKIWGVEPSAIDAEQARRRVSAGSLSRMLRKVLNSVPGLKPKGAGMFYYPRNGFGSISESYAAAAEQAGATLRLGTSVTGVLFEDGRVSSVQVRTGNEIESIPARLVFSTVPLSLLVRSIHPALPEPVLEAACSLRFRSMILIYLVLATEQFTEYDAHYFPGSDVPITRLSEPKNYGLAALPGKTVLCAELPCSTDDPVWTAGVAELGELVKKALTAAGLPVRAKVEHVQAIRLPQAYPVYTCGYRAHFDRIDNCLESMEGLVTFGRQGLFAHDNTHHALAMAYAIDDCVAENGSFQRDKWATYRRRFETHVVED